MRRRRMGRNVTRRPGTFRRSARDVNFHVATCPGKNQKKTSSRKETEAQNCFAKKRAFIATFRTKTNFLRLGFGGRGGGGNSTTENTQTEDPRLGNRSFPWWSNIGQVSVLFSNTRKAYEWCRTCVNAGRESRTRIHRNG